MHISIIRISSIIFVSIVLFSCSASVEKNEILPDTDNLRENIKELASDAYEGRSPSSPGETKTISYLADQFNKAGISPGNGDSYFQEVPLTAKNTLPGNMVINGEGNSTTLVYKKDMMVFSERNVDHIEIEQSEIVFAGYGIVAPEFEWNDYADLDVKGKTVLVLVNDPGYVNQKDDFFTGKSMTYYGRYTYKYEEAARQGAEAILVIHSTGPAGYPWEVVSGSWSGTSFGLISPNQNMDRSAAEGWITDTAVKQLFDNANLNYDSIVARAASPGSKSVSLKQTMNVSMDIEIQNSVSNNVIGIIEGSENPDEYIIFTAHWDHLGKDPMLPGDQIYNGAADNATGTAGILELARLFKSTGPHKRSLLFLAVTAEEKGLLGSQYYSENPIYPLKNTVANINVDVMNTYGPTNDITVVGYGNSQLDNYLIKYATEAGITVKPEPTPEKGYYFRSDHFNFAKVGVPALYTETGITHTELSSEWMTEQMDLYAAERYHKPADEYNPDWDLRGMIQEMNLLYQIGHELANSSDWPEWSEGVSFKAIRDQQRN